jgi:Fe-S oxidoreductase
VNLPLLKAELQRAGIEKHGRSMRQRLFASLDSVGRLGCIWPGLSNRVVGFLVFRTLFAKALGLAWQRPLPSFAPRRFDRWFKKRQPEGPGHRGRVILWDDTFVRYFEPNIGVAAVRVLEAAGFRVELVKNRKCCGRPAFSQGDLDAARKLGEHNCGILGGDSDEAPILFLEPSCYSMFVQDYEELCIPGARSIARRCHLFDHFIAELLSQEPHALRFDPVPARVVIHAHCHVRSLMSPAFLKTLTERLPGREVFLLETGCCGMAGGFGAMQANYELSLKVAEPLTGMVRAQPFGTVVIASGTSCRQQIGHLAPVRPRHMAEVLAQALTSDR